MGAVSLVGLLVTALGLLQISALFSRDVSAISALFRNVRRTHKHIIQNVLNTGVQKANRRSYHLCRNAYPFHHGRGEAFES